MEQTTPDAKPSRTAAARAALLASGVNPHQRGQQHQREILSWIYRWGWTSSGLIQQLARRTAGGLAQRYADKGLLVQTKTVSGQPRHYYTLSGSGLEYVEGRCVENLLRYKELDPFRVNQQTLRHYLLAQTVTLNALQANSIAAFITEREAGVADSDGHKRPDVSWILQSGAKVGIEIELSSKWGRDADDFVLGVWRALNATPEQPARYARFAVITDSPAIKKRYRELFAPGATAQTWEKNERHHWVVTKKLRVPDWLQGKVDFKLVE
jgi:hypothetical protein